VSPAVAELWRGKPSWVALWRGKPELQYLAFMSWAGVRSETGWLDEWIFLGTLGGGAGLTTG